ncbi:MAG: flagellar export protein FliJ [Gammaproteobacteria bacterium]|nr:flagellar export protein FliJ [Gammaproteobacteria bacterium]
MTKSDRFRPLQHVASSRERDAARALGESERRRLEEVQRLEALRQYHAEYLERFRSAQQRGMTVGRLLEYQAFLAKLDKAVDHQLDVVRRCEAEAGRRQDAWREKYTRSRVMDKVIDNLQETERQEGERRDQADLDERNQRRR